MAPFGNTMRFVNGNQADLGGIYHLNKAFVIEPFGSHISRGSFSDLSFDRALSLTVQRDGPHVHAFRTRLAQKVFL